MPVIPVRTFLNDVRTLSPGPVMRMCRANLPLLKWRLGSLVTGLEFAPQTGVLHSAYTQTIGREIDQFVSGPS